MHKALLLAAAVVVAAPVPASAAINVYTTNLTGGQEVPPVTTTGTGTGRVFVDDVLNTIRIQITFSGLLGTTTAAHIHCCAAPGANAGVVSQLPSFPGFPLGVQSGSFDATFDLTLASTYNPAFVTANGGTALGARNALLAGLNSGLAYLNVHSSRNLGGEIRGQLAPVPEPATWLLMLAGFGLAGWSLRRRNHGLVQAA